MFPADDRVAVQLFRLWVFREDVKAMLSFKVREKEDKRIGATLWAQRSVLFRHIAITVYEGLRLLVPGSDDKEGQKQAKVIRDFIDEARRQGGAFRQAAELVEEHLPALEAERERLRRIRNKLGGHFDTTIAKKALRSFDDYAGILVLGDSVAATRYDAPSEVAFLACLNSAPSNAKEMNAAFREFLGGFSEAHNAIMFATDGLLWLWAARRGLLRGVTWGRSTTRFR